MNGLFGKYLARNALHYRKKYSIVFALILAPGFCLALTSYFYAGELAASIRYARLRGDVQLDVDYGASDTSHEELSTARKAAFHDDLAAWFAKNSAHSFMEIPIIPGKMMSGTWGEEISVMGMNAAREAYCAALYSGEVPGPGQACLPKDLENSVKIGDAVSFVYRDSDQVYCGETFTVSGFFLPAHAFEGMAFVNDETLAALDPALLPRRFISFDAPRDARMQLMTETESVARKGAIEAIALRHFRDLDFVRAHAETRSAYDNYRAARDIVDFFLAILVVFIACLCVVSSISIVNVLFVTVIDRVRIVGMMFSFGLGRKRGIMLLAGEILVFAVVASVVGIALAALVAGKVGGITIRNDNKMLETLLGGSSSLPLLVGWQSAVITLIAGAVIPFFVSSMTISKILTGEIVNLIQRAR